MPQRPARPCAFPRCPALVRDSKYCDLHQQHENASRRQYDQQRGTMTARGYGVAWQALRKEILLRDGYECQHCHCFVGHRRWDAHVHHVVSKAKGGTDDPSNLIVLCGPCHSKVTIAEDGGFGHRVR